MYCASTSRILVMNGGGNRGYTHPKFLNTLATKLNTTVDELWRVYHVIAGTSAGGIMACALAAGKSYSDMMEFFNKTSMIFTIRSITDIGSCNASTPSNKPNFLEKAAMLFRSDPFYKSVVDCETNNYGSTLLYDVIDDYFYNMTLNDLNCKVVIPAIDATNNKFVMFSNYQKNNMFLSGEHKVADVCKATSAAPMYLPQWTIGSSNYEDGGLYANNPASVAIEVARDLNIYTNRIVLTHCTTGVSNLSFDGSPPPPTPIEPPEPGETPPVIPPATRDSVIAQLMSVPEKAMTGSQELADFVCKLKSQSHNINDKFYYYSFAPKLPDSFDSELDNSTDMWYNQLNTIITNKLISDNALIDNHVTHLKLL